MARALPLDGKSVTETRKQAFERAVASLRTDGHTVDVLHGPWEEDDGSGWWAVVLRDGERCEWKWLEEIGEWL